MCRKPPGVRARNTFLQHYKRSAIDRGFTFSLSDDYFFQLVESCCHYCGSEPDKVSISNGGKFIHLGLDRVDNAKGYEVGNAVPCCDFCNLAKRNKSVEEFRAWIGRIVKHHTNKQIERKKHAEVPEIVDHPGDVGCCVCSELSDGGPGQSGQSNL
jgi:hypothetical protein